MNTETIQAIQAHALEAYPLECCGLVIAEGRREVYVRCSNVADNPAENFQIPASEWAAAEARGEVLAVAHSHPDGVAEPSLADRSVAVALGLPWVICAVHTDPATPARGPYVHDCQIHVPESFELPLRGREYVFGVTDCYSLIRDFYSREMGVELPDFERRDKFWERGENLYMDNLETTGFQLIPAPSQKGDLILMAIRSEIVNHGAIWLGEGDAILHHPYRQLSERTVFGGFWYENTRFYARKVS